MNTDDSSWIFDSLVCFLNGPVWNAPLQSFIEEKSLIFEPNNNDNPEYKVIYEEFKNLVDLMLGTYMEDIGITPEQFENACSKEYTSELPLHFQKNLFEQIWAANDYNVFIRMMCQKNIELQLQALELIKTKHGFTSDLFSTSKTTVCQIENQNEHDIEPCVTTENEKQMATKAYDLIEVNDFEIEKISTEFENQLQDELKIKKQELDKALESALTEATSSYKAEQSTVQPEIQDNHDKINTFDSLHKTVDTKAIDKDELKKRQEYLKLQRDRLVAMKKQLREKQLKTSLVADDTSTEKRPRSAKIAEAVLNSSQTQPESQSLQIRRALAEKLRTEVVSNKE